MGLVFNNKEFKKEFIKLSIPLIIQELINNLLASIAILILGLKSNVSDEVISITYAFNIFFLFNITMLGIVFTTSALISQLYGKGDALSIKRAFFKSQIIGLIISLLFLIISMSIPSLLISIFTDKKEIINLSSSYLRIFSISFIFTSISIVNSTLLKSVKLEKEATLSTLISLLTNIIFSIIFVFTLYDNIGIISLAISNILSRIIELIFTTFFVIKLCKINFKDIFNDKEFNKKLNQYFLKHSLPLIISKFAWASGFIAFSAIIGRLDKDVMLANSILNTMRNYIICISSGVATSVGITLARELGKNDLNKVNELRKTFTKLIVFLGIVMLTLFIIELPISMLIYKESLNANSFKYLWVFFTIYSITFASQSCNSIMENGILNAGGDTLFVTIIDIIVPWCIVFPLGIIGLKFDLNPILIFTFLSLDEIIRMPLNIIRYKKEKWIKNVT